jgi:hypothetical protein
MISRSRSLKNGPLLIVLCLIGIFQLETIRPGMVGGEDSALYLSHARNLAFHRPYLATGYLYSVETARYSPAAYPPIFPIMLAPVFRLYGLNPAPYKELMACIVVLCAFATALLYQDEMKRPQLLLFLILVGINPFITDQKNEIMSDLPFLLFLNLSFLCFRDKTELGTPPRPYLVRGILAGFLSYLAYGTRAVGLGIILSAIVVGLITYRKLPRLIVVAIVVFALFAGIQSVFLSINSDYLRIAMFKGHSPLENLHFYAGVASYWWDAGIGRVPRLLIFGIATALCLVGVWRQSYKTWDLPTVFGIGYATFLIFSPYHQARYLIPLLPIYFYYLVRGMYAASHLMARGSRRWATAIALGFAVIFLATYIRKDLTYDLGPSPDAWDSETYRQLYASIDNFTPENAVIIAGAPRALALYADRTTAQFPEHLDAQHLTRYIAEVRATHLLVPRATANQWLSLCGTACAIDPVFSNANYVLYKTTLSSPIPHSSEEDGGVAE